MLVYRNRLLSGCQLHLRSPNYILNDLNLVVMTQTMVEPCKAMNI